MFRDETPPFGNPDIDRKREMKPDTGLRRRAATRRSVALQRVLGTSSLSPAQRGRDVREDCFDHVRIVLDAERVRHGQQ
jgi:hypothetical protein